MTTMELLLSVTRVSEDTTANRRVLVVRLSPSSTRRLVPCGGVVVDEKSSYLLWFVGLSLFCILTNTRVFVVSI
jgi:hypothetical protein